MMRKHWFAAWLASVLVCWTFHTRADVSTVPIQFECRGPQGLVYSGTEEGTVSVCQQTVDSDPSNTYLLGRFYRVGVTPPPQLVTRLVAFGDSATAGPPTQTALVQLSGLLSVPLTNLAVGGGTSSSLLTKVRTHTVIAGAEYYLWNNGNELSVCLTNLSCNLTYYTSNSATNIRSAVTSLQGKGVTDIVVIGPFDGGYAPSAINAGKGARARVLSQAYDAQIRSKLTGLNVVYVPMLEFTGELVSVLGSGAWYSDGVHFSVEAHRRIALRLQSFR